MERLSVSQIISKIENRMNFLQYNILPPLVLPGSSTYTLDTMPLPGGYLLAAPHAPGPPRRRTPRLSRAGKALARRAHEKRKRWAGKAEEPPLRSSAPPISSPVQGRPRHKCPGSVQLTAGATPRSHPPPPARRRPRAPSPPGRPTSPRAGSVPAPAATRSGGAR